MMTHNASRGTNIARTSPRGDALKGEQITSGSTTIHGGENAPVEEQLPPLRFGFQVDQRADSGEAR